MSTVENAKPTRFEPAMSFFNSLFCRWKRALSAMSLSAFNSAVRTFLENNPRMVNVTSMMPTLDAIVNAVAVWRGRIPSSEMRFLPSFLPMLSDT